MDPSFDEYEIHGSSPMLAPLSEKLAAVDQRLAAIEAKSGFWVVLRDILVLFPFWWL